MRYPNKTRFQGDAKASDDIVAEYFQNPKDPCAHAGCPETCLVPCVQAIDPHWFDCETLAGAGAQGPPAFSFLPIQTTYFALWSLSRIQMLFRRAVEYTRI